MKKNTATKDLEYYLKLRYPVTLVPEAEGGYTALINDLPGCMSEGESASEAMEMIEDARRSWLGVAVECGTEIPLPSTEREYNGKVLVRMPPSLHQKLVDGASLDEVSLNQYICYLLAERNTIQAVRREIAGFEYSINSLGQRLEPTPTYTFESSQAGYQNSDFDSYWGQGAPQYAIQG